MTWKIDSSGSAAVDPTYFWIPIAEEKPPLNVKVQLLGSGDVATYGIWDTEDKFFTHWCPLPIRKRKHD